MVSNAVHAIADTLLRGTMPDAQTWDIGSAVCLIADQLSQQSARVTNDSVRSAVKTLNDHRGFEHTRVLGQAWRDLRGFDATITRRHAQALINLSALDEAENLLIDGLQRIKTANLGAQATSEIPEYEGLMGRVYKQRFVMTNNADYLGAATDQYLAQYETPNQPFWHGINAVALLTRERQQGIHRANLPSPLALAEKVRQQVSQAYKRSQLDPWCAATLSEACLALGENDLAELWLYRFLHHPNVKPFDVDSYDRQLREIWLGSLTGGDAAGADRLTIIMARHIARTQLRWSLSSSSVTALALALKTDATVFEKNFSGESSFSVETVKRMLQVCASIGCVCNVSGERLGTGFLVNSADLGGGHASSPVFVTNAHVISDTVVGAVKPKDARITFEVESANAAAPVFYSIDKVLFSSDPGDLGKRQAATEKLDITIVSLKNLPAKFVSLTMAPTLPLVQPKSKAYVVGHPRGSGLQISLHDSLLLDIDDDERLVHYRTPTDPGSSGSPVFNSLWEVMALHHAGSVSTPRLRGEGSYEANEGIALSAIRRAFSHHAGIHVSAVEH